MKNLDQLTNTEKWQILTLYWDCYYRLLHTTTEMIALQDPDWPGKPVEYQLCQHCATQMRAIMAA
jgi:hypothetical protein